MEDYSIVISNVAKSYKVYFDKGQTLKEKILFRNRNKYEKRQVLKDINLNVKKGEAVGIVGQNGCGKSTLLKLMTGIIYPDKGNIEIKGRVSSLIELGAGFHPDMSGRENIYTNASIFGLSRKEIDLRMGEIMDFSELGEYIDNPVRIYSSGMYMRLAFAVAIHVNADVLLVDEILAVGDAAFQAKCFNKMREIKAAGVTIVIVSHGLGPIEQLCEMSYWIDDGVIRKQGKPFDVHPEYMDYMGQKSNPLSAQKDVQLINDNEEKTEEETPSPVQGERRFGDKDAEIVSVKLLDENEEPKILYKTGDYMNIRISYKVHKPVKNPIVGLRFYRNDGLSCYGTNSYVAKLHIQELAKDGIIECRIMNNSLLPGEYFLAAAIHNIDGLYCDYIKNAIQFSMYSNAGDIGIARLEHKWVLGNNLIK